MADSPMRTLDSELTEVGLAPKYLSGGIHLVSQLIFKRYTIVQPVRSFIGRFNYSWREVAVTS